MPSTRAVPQLVIDMDTFVQTELLMRPTIGKFVSDHVYLHISAFDRLPNAWRERITRAVQLAGVTENQDFNVVKLRLDGEELSLLSYPDFFAAAFPELSKSWRVRLSPESVIYRTYGDSLNPPILHRKELLLPPEHPDIAQYEALTSAAESLGLFDDTSRIGLREYWHQLIATRGYVVDGLQLVPIANASESEVVTTDSAPGIQRHLTALSRSNFSAPVQALWRHELIDVNRTFFDYGCGKGDDVRGLLANGIDARGWDPYYCPNAEKRCADTVNIGFVINVIEDLGERIDALRFAFSYTDSVLSVAAMLSSQTPPEGRPHFDGYLTSRNTFQKYYSQLQLRDFIEHALDEPAIAVGPGVFFVFKDKKIEQRFLAARYGRRGNIALLRGWVSPRLQREARNARRTQLKERKPDRETMLFEVHQANLQTLWLRCLELGRFPEATELDPKLFETLNDGIGSLPKALRIATRHFGADELTRSAEQKRSDILVFAALLQFQKRRPYRQLEETLQYDIRYFYRDYTNLQATARKALFESVSPEVLDAACNVAAEKGLGWLEESHSLQLHVSLLDRLPAVLRIYVGCATILAGDTSEYDLVKIHIRSGKVTLMRFDDFTESPLPRLLQRIKVKLRELDLDLFEYGDAYPSPLLYYKSRYINEEYPHFSQQVEFEEQLDRLNLFDLRGYGPPANHFFSVIRQARWDIAGFKLVRSQELPDLDSQCGAHFTYRQLIECGETQQRTKMPNVPQQPDTYTALHDLAVAILDPVIDYFGMIELTYGFCSARLAKAIKANIAPYLDQHAGHEKNRLGNPICSRLGAACDFLVRDEDMEEVAKWIIVNTPVDRLYFYGKDRPIHVSFSETPARQFVRLIETPSGRRIPKIDKGLNPGNIQ